MSLFKFCFLFCGVLFSFGLKAQNEFYEYTKEPAFLSSVYNNCATADSSHASSVLHLLLSNEGKKWELNDKAIVSCFKVFPDKDVIYDAATKTYFAQLPNIIVEDSTYASADRLSIVFNGISYSANCIDGGCDVHLKYLKHKYIVKSTGEQLTLRVTHDFPLEVVGGIERKPLIIRKGSILSFDVQKKPCRVH